MACNGSFTLHFIWLQETCKSGLVSIELKKRSYGLDKQMGDAATAKSEIERTKLLYAWNNIIFRLNARKQF